MGLLTRLFGAEADILRESDLQSLVVANTVGLIGLSLLSPILSSLTGPFGTTSGEIGLLMSAYTAPAVVMIPVVGVLADRFGRKPVILAGLFLLSTGGTLIAFTTDFQVAIGLRFVQGVGGSALTPIIITALGDMYDGTREAAAQGFRFTGSGLTQLVFPLLAGVLVGISWQFPFYLHLVGFPIILLVYRWFDEPLSEPTGARSVGPTRWWRSPRTRQLVDLLTDPSVAIVVIARSLSAVVWIAFLTYNSIIVLQLIGGSAVQAGIVAALASFVSAVTASQVSRLPIGDGNALSILAGAHVVSGVGFLVVVLSPAFPLAVGGTLLLGLGQGVTGTLFRSVITGIPTESVRGTFVSLTEAVGRLMVTLTPILMSVYITLTQARFAFDIAVRSAGVLVTTLAAGSTIVLLTYVSYRGDLPRQESGA